MVSGVETKSSDARNFRYEAPGCRHEASGCRQKASNECHRYAIYRQKPSDECQYIS